MKINLLLIPISIGLIFTLNCGKSNSPRESNANQSAETNALSNSSNQENLKISDIGDIPDGDYKIRGKNSGKCLYIEGKQFEKHLFLQDCADGDKQLDMKIHLKAVDYNIYIIQFLYSSGGNGANLCLTFPGNPERGALIQEPCNNSEKQKWRITLLDGKYWIKNPTSNMCVDVANNDVINGAVVNQWDCHPEAEVKGNQLWALDPWQPVETPEASPCQNYDKVTVSGKNAKDFIENKAACDLVSSKYNCNLMVKNTGIYETTGRIHICAKIHWENHPYVGQDEYKEIVHAGALKSFGTTTGETNNDVSKMRIIDAMFVKSH